MKIALLGSAPSSIHLAPYNDPSWTIWGCSPGASAVARRIDAWFEIHELADASVVTPDYLAWLKLMGENGKTVYCIEASEKIPNSVRYPIEEMVSRFGEYFWTSSVSYMLALAITMKPEEIGLWGIDMSAQEEYHGQRPACHYFIEKARDAGIKVTTTMQSDLLRPPQRYGYTTVTHMHQKLTARKAELSARLAAVHVTYENAVREEMFLKGAIDDLEYILNTWVD